MAVCGDGAAATDWVQIFWGEGNRWRGRGPLGRDGEALLGTQAAA
jgi:hypothetical protein